MPNTERNITPPNADLVGMFTTPLSDRVARLKEAAGVAHEQLEQASTHPRIEEAGSKDLILHAALATIEDALDAVGF